MPGSRNGRGDPAASPPARVLVPGAWVVADSNRFLWVLGYDGDYEAANATYYASAERQAIDPGPARHLERAEHWPLREVLLVS
jgi:hypothetical protein